MILQVLFIFLYCCLLGWSLGIVVTVLLRQFVLAPWGGASMYGIKAVVRVFAVQPAKLKIELSPTKLDCGAWYGPALGEYSDQTNVIRIDMRLIRSPARLVDVLLHEICHHNQSMGRRLRLGLDGLYYLQPIEREARAFASAWGKVALRIYRTAEEVAKNPKRVVM